MSEITSLEPRLVWEQFDAITRVPRPSKKEGKIIDFLVGFAKKHNIEYKKDAVGNVVMRKPATPGFEGRPAVILQSHMDMVCEKNSDVEFDFDNDPIRTRIDGACKYFRSKLATDLVGPLDILEQVKPGARLNAERWKELYADYRQALGEKMLVLEAMLGKPFNTGTYLTARRQAVLEAGSHKKARKVKVSVKKRPKKE